MMMQEAGNWRIEEFIVTGEGEMTDEMTPLRAALNAARSTRLNVEKEQREARVRLIDEVTERLNKRFGERLAAAVAAERAAQTAFNNAEVARATVAHADKLASPDLLEWDHDGSNWLRHRSPKKLTGRRGRYEIWTAESHTRRYIEAEPGSIVIRILKKDGSPSLLATTHGDWLPEGVKPKGAADD